MDEETQKLIETLIVMRATMSALDYPEHVKVTQRAIDHLRKQNESILWLQDEVSRLEEAANVKKA